MQYIAIKEELQNDKKIYTINAIPLKNKEKSIVQKIPHPIGTDTLTYKTLDEAVDAIKRAGFSPILPNGKKDTSLEITKKSALKSDNSYETMILDVIKSKINSSNPNVCQAAVLALAEFPSEETFDILFDKIGEENDLIRKNAILSICRYGNRLSDKLIEALTHENWVTRNSAINCIKNLAQENDIDLEKFIVPLLNSCEDINPIVQANALSVLAMVYQNFKKKK